ncbi:MAG: hypothetical protein WCT02_03750 [Candidatus Paceibacterota bacterium]|jgi:hypothetical protein
MNFASVSRSNDFIKTISFALIALFLLVWILGSFGPHLIANHKCYAFFGCNGGFFGFDAFQHFLSGPMDVALIIWLSRKHEKVNLFQEKFWKNFLIIVAIVALVAVLWEIIEYGHDEFRMDVLGRNLTSPNLLDQPTNSDTMGDMTMTLVGASLAAVALRPLIPKK